LLPTRHDFVTRFLLSGGHRAKHGGRFYRSRESDLSRTMALKQRSLAIRIDVVSSPGTTSRWIGDTSCP
jgi:hypothetical protein